MYFKCDANNKYLYTFVSLVDKYLHFESKNKWLFRFISFHLKKKKTSAAILHLRILRSGKNNDKNMAKGNFESSSFGVYFETCEEHTPIYFG